MHSHFLLDLPFCPKTNVYNHTQIISAGANVPYISKNLASNVFILHEFVEPRKYAP